MPESSALKSMTYLMRIICRLALVRFGVYPTLAVDEAHSSSRSTGRSSHARAVGLGGCLHDLTPKFRAGRVFRRQPATASNIRDLPRCTCTSRSSVVAFRRARLRSTAQSTWSEAAVNTGGPLEDLLRNYASQVWASDFFIVVTVHFQTLYAFVVVSLERRRIVHVDVTAHPTGGWVAQRMMEAVGDAPPCYLLHDRDSIYDARFRGRLRGSIGSRAQTARGQPPLQACGLPRIMRKSPAMGSRTRPSLHHEFNRPWAIPEAIPVSRSDH
jgi:hypothetical protein